jgi:hypothetical protein
MRPASRFNYDSFLLCSFFTFVKPPPFADLGSVPKDTFYGIPSYLRTSFGIGLLSLDFTRYFSGSYDVPTSSL